jgi:hypothetical protein
MIAASFNHKPEACAAMTVGHASGLRVTEGSGMSG